MIKSLGKSLLLGMINLKGSNDKFSIKKMFAHVSLSLGGDGLSLSKSQLKTYLDKYENNPNDLYPKKTKLAKTLYANWDKLFGNTDKISAEDYTKAPAIFNAIVVSEAEEEQGKQDLEEKKLNEKKKKEQAEKNSKDNFNKLKEKLNCQKEGITKDKLKNYLKELIEKNSNEDKNNDDDDDFDIDFIVNLIDEFENLSGNTDSIKDFKKITEYSSNKELSPEDFKTPVNLSV